MGVVAEVEAFREEYRRANIGPHYRGELHFAFTSVASLAVIVTACMRVSHVRPLEWVVLPAMFLFSNAAEYFGHKGPMHHPRPGLGLLFQRHTREHHRFFTSEAMAYGSWRDVKMVLLPPVMLVFFLGAVAGPIAAMAFYAWSANAGWLTVACGMGYFLTYEWLHFAYHLREDSWVGRLPLVARLRRHHARHHDLRVMQRGNFNITFPVWDVILGTYLR